MDELVTRIIVLNGWLDRSWMAYENFVKSRNFVMSMKTNYEMQKLSKRIAELEWLLFMEVN